MVLCAQPVKPLLPLRGEVFGSLLPLALTAYLHGLWSKRLAHVSRHLLMGSEPNVAAGLDVSD